ncbi:MAG TPA: O-antigen ligase family protein [Gaiellaceae bacterium]|jgi:hypothetical protein|nr:O-antigen ligase family protein [Gaiellaceae bacterium]
MPRRFWLLAVFVVGLAVHNLAMALLYGAGLRGSALTAVEAWKDVLLAGALCWYAVRALRSRELPFRPNAVDALALAFGALVCLYALLPQGWLGGSADLSGIAHGLRHDLLFVGGYFLGCCLGPLPRRLPAVLVATAALVGLFGLVEEYAVSLDWWRHSGARGWFQHQLGFDYRGLSGLPENFVYNLGNDEIVRRLIGTFLGPLATAFLLCVALLAAAAWRRRWTILPAAVAAAALLWTYSRSTWLALAFGLVVLALAQRRLALVAVAAVWLAVAAGYAQAFPHVAPEAHFTPTELRFQRNHAKGSDTSVSLADDASTRSHLRNLRDGIETVARHPQGFGLGNSGSTAARFGAAPKAGESTYTEVGVDAGLAGLVLFCAFNLLLLWRLLRRSPWVAAALAAVLALAVQTDVIGVPWLAFCLWAFAGAELARNPRELPAA